MQRLIGTAVMALLALLSGCLLLAAEGIVGGLPLGFILLYGAVVAVVLVTFLRRGIAVARAAILIAFLAWLPVVYLVDWSSRKPFLRDLARVQPGMSRLEVAQIMAAYMRGTGMSQNPLAPGPGTLQDLGTGQSYATDNSPAGEVILRGSEVFRHGNDGAYDADWGVVCYEGDRVARVEFSPD